MISFIASLSFRACGAHTWMTIGAGKALACEFEQRLEASRPNGLPPRAATLMRRYLELHFERIDAVERELTPEPASPRPTTAAREGKRG